MEIPDRSIFRREFHSVAAFVTSMHHKRRTTRHQLLAATGYSMTNIDKHLARLRATKLIRTWKGPYGGIWLTKEVITVEDIARAMNLPLDALTENFRQVPVTQLFRSFQERYEEAEAKEREKLPLR